MSTYLVRSDSEDLELEILLKVTIHECSHNVSNYCWLTL